MHAACFSNWTVACCCAAGAGCDPGRISFTATLHAAQRTLRASPGPLAAALNATEAEILTSLVPRRDGRLCARAVNKPSSPYRSKHNHNGPISQHVTCTVTITTPARHTGTSTDQAKQPTGRPANPP